MTDEHKRPDPVGRVSLPEREIIEFEHPHPYLVAMYIKAVDEIRKIYMMIIAEKKKRKNNHASDN